jgi:hypothetical protein
MKYLLLIVITLTILFSSGCGHQATVWYKENGKTTHRSFQSDNLIEVFEWLKAQPTNNMTSFYVSQ